MRILIAEDDLDISTLYKKALEQRKHDVVLTPNGKDCLESYICAFHVEARNKKSILATRHRDDTASVPQNIKSKHEEPTPSSSSTYDVVILDYKMPGINGMDVAKEILEFNPNQRIIFASAYVKETLEDSVKQLKQVVELMQKPFAISQLVSTVEDIEVYKELKRLNVDVNLIRSAEPSHELLIALLEKLRKIQKYRTF